MNILKQIFSVAKYPLLVLVVLNLLYFYIPLVPKEYILGGQYAGGGHTEVYPITAHKYMQEYICLKKGYACNDRILNGPEVSWEHSKLYIPANVTLFVLMIFLVFFTRKLSK
jgi:hypothetical protein